MMFCSISWLAGRFVSSLVRNRVLTQLGSYCMSDFFKKRSLFWSENFKNFVSGF